MRSGKGRYFGADELHMSGYLHPDHGIKIDYNGFGFVGVCSCGFKGRQRKDTREASGDLGEHLADVAIGEVKRSEKQGDI